MFKTFFFRKSGYLLLVLVSVAALVACNKVPAYTPVSSSNNQVYDFWLEKTTSNISLNRPYEGMIIGDSLIRLTVDYGTDITALEPTIFVGADSVFPVGKQNFSNPVKYIIWANGKARTYTVKITASTIQNPKFIAIAGGYSHLLALKNDGTLWALGDNESSQLGLGDLSNRNILTQVPVYDVAQIFTGNCASIVKLKDGTAWGTGNQYGQLGLGNVNGVYSFTRVPFLDDARQVAITFGEVLVLKPDGSVWGAGENNTQLLAQGNNNLYASFVKLPINNVQQLGGYGYDVEMLKTTGNIWAWGLNRFGELATGDSLQKNIPVQITTSFTTNKMFAGSNACFVMDNYGKIWATGVNASAQLGLGDTKNRSSYTQVSFFNNKSIDLIAPGLTFTAFKETNGNVWLVGSNAIGEMGISPITAAPCETPIQLSNFSATALAGVGSTVYALKADSTLWAWGSNQSGALGVASSSQYSAVPVQIQ